MTTQTLRELIQETYVCSQNEENIIFEIARKWGDRRANAKDKRIVELESALWYLIGDVEAAHRSHIPAPGDPPITDKEIANLLRAQSLLANYRPDEYETNGH